MADEPSALGGAPSGGPQRRTRTGTPFASKAKLELDTSKLRTATADVKKLYEEFDRLFNRLDTWARNEAKRVADAFGVITNSMSGTSTTAGMYSSQVSSMGQAQRATHERQAAAVDNTAGGNPSAPSDSAAPRERVPNGGRRGGDPGGLMSESGLAREALQFGQAWIATAPIRYASGLVEPGRRMDAIGAMYQQRMGTQNLNGGIRTFSQGIVRSTGPEDQLAAGSALMPWSGTNQWSGMLSSTNAFTAMAPGLSAEQAAQAAAGFTGTPYLSLRQRGISVYGRGGTMRSSSQIFSELAQTLNITSRSQAARIMTPNSREYAAASAALGGDQQLMEMFSAYATQSATYRENGGRGMYNPNLSSHVDKVPGLGSDENMAASGLVRGDSAADRDFAMMMAGRSGTLAADRAAAATNELLGKVLDTPLSSILAAIAASGFGNMIGQFGPAAFAALRGGGVLGGGAGGARAALSMAGGRATTAFAATRLAGVGTMGAGTIGSLVTGGVIANRTIGWGVDQLPTIHAGDVGIDPKAVYEVGARLGPAGVFEHGLDMLTGGLTGGDALRGRHNTGPCKSCAGNRSGGLTSGNGGIGISRRRGKRGDASRGRVLPHNEPSDTAVTKLHPELYQKLQKMFAAHAQEHPNGPFLFVESGFRSPEEQMILRRQNCTDPEDPNSYCSPVTAMPGQSNHQKGLAADIGPGSMYGWIVANASRFGLHLPVASEDWHVESVGTTPMNDAATGGQTGDMMAGSKSYNVGGGGDDGGSSTASVGGAGMSMKNLFSSFMGGPPGPSSMGGGSRGGSGGAGSIGVSGSGWSTGAGALSGEQVARAAYAAGFRGQDLVRMVAIAFRESGFNPMALNPNAPDYSVGLWQINMLAHGTNYGTEDQLYDPLQNARAAMAIFQSQGWNAWTTNSGVDHLDLQQASKYVQSAGVGDAMRGRPGGKRRESGGGGLTLNNPQFSVKIERATEEEAEQFVRMVMARISEEASLMSSRQE